MSFTKSSMKFRQILAISLLSLAGPAQAADDSTFLAAREAFRKGDAARLEAAVAASRDHPLAIYAESYLLRNRLAKDDPLGIPIFLIRNEGSIVAEKLREDWIAWLAKREDWPAVEREYANLQAPGREETCLVQRARLQRGDRRVLDEVNAYWEEMLEPDENCLPLLDALVVADRVNVDRAWRRIRQQIEIHRPTPARQTMEYLPDSQIPSREDFENATRKAMSYLARQPDDWYRKRGDRELTAIAIRYLATNDPLIAAEQLKKRESRLGHETAAWAWSQIALQAARRHLPEAPIWYLRSRGASLSEDNQQWRVRAALRNQNWGQVRQAIEDMDRELAARPEWIYWLGRAYKAGGRISEANALFARIAGQPNFYGNLADEELGRQIQPPAPTAAPGREEMQAAANNPGLQRALLLFDLDMRTEAVREWNWALREMNDRQLLAAAELARKNQIWDRAINTAERTRNEHDYRLRFLSPFSDRIVPAAHQQSLDEAWVYGLMRQESRFVTNARSSAGAGGLMQLMPATARWVARKIGLTGFRPSQVHDADVNVLLGTSYMRMVMEDLDNHPVLASAAYNAGPGRARRWRGEQALEGAIYAETIPFSETRDYVKKVMSNAVYYSLILNGKPDSLKRRLGIVAPAATQGSPTPGLP